MHMDLIASVKRAVQITDTSHEHDTRYLIACCVVVGRLSVTKMIRFVAVWWISRLPSRVGLMCLKMPL